jgi:probable F420-dependent oxidoreductase
MGTDPIATRDFAQAAEALGYEHIVTYDHVLGAEHANRAAPLFGPYTENDPFHEPFVLFGFMAAVTSTIDLMTGVLILPQRQTALVAKQAAELAVLSQGRFRLGVGTGWNYVEYEALGSSFDERGRMLDEQVAVLRTLWRESLVDYTGDYHRIDRANLLPRPASAIPIWFGGAAPAAIRRAAKVGDGFTFGAANDMMKGLCQQLTQALEANGRRDAFGIDVMMGYGGGPEHWHREIDAWEMLGADTISMRAMSTGAALLREEDPGFTTPQQHIDALETFMKEVG